MSFQTQYEIANMKNQIEPQQLTQNVFFGPINSLTRLDFLLRNNIKHFICINIPTVQAMKYCEKIPLDKYDFNFISFDSNFNKSDYTTEKLFEIMCFNQTYSAQLFNYIKDALPSVGEVLNKEIYNMNSLSVLQSNIIGVSPSYERFEIFNDFLTIVKNVNQGNVLVISSNGNDENLTTLLVSQVMRENCTVDPLDAIKYVKSLRPTIQDINLTKIQFSPGFIDYCEKIKSKSWNDIVTYQKRSMLKKKQVRRSNDYDFIEQENIDMQESMHQHDAYSNHYQQIPAGANSYKRTRRDEFE